MTSQDTPELVERVARAIGAADTRYVFVRRSGYRSTATDAMRESIWSIVDEETGQTLFTGTEAEATVFHHNLRARAAIEAVREHDRSVKGASDTDPRRPMSEMW